MTGDQEKFFDLGFFTQTLRMSDFNLMLRFHHGACQLWRRF